MIEFTLIIIFHINSGFAVQSVPFKSLEACNQARKLVIARIHAKDHQDYLISADCTPTR